MLPYLRNVKLGKSLLEFDQIFETTNKFTKDQCRTASENEKTPNRWERTPRRISRCQISVSANIMDCEEHRQ